MWSLVFTSLISSCLHFCLHASWCCSSWELSTWFFFQPCHMYNETSMWINTLPFYHLSSSLDLWLFIHNCKVHFYYLICFYSKTHLQNNKSCFLFFLTFDMTYILHCLSLSYELQILEFRTLIISLAFAPLHLSFYFEMCLHESMHVGKDLQKCDISCVLCFVPFPKVINSKPQTSIS